MTALISTVADPAWVLGGAAMVVIGIILIRWAARNDATSEIKDAAVDATIEALSKRGRSGDPSGIKTRLAELAEAEGIKGKANKVARYSVRNSLSQIAGISGFILLMAGLVLAAIGIFGT